MTLRRPKPALLACLVFVVALACASTVAFAASANQRTKGAAEAVLRAAAPGGGAIFAHNRDAHGVPLQGFYRGDPTDVRIYPLFDAEYCASGWHVISLAYFDDPAFYESNQELFDILSASKIDFVLDGAPLEAQRTAISRFRFPPPLTGVDDAFVFTTGALLPPGTLALGAHQLQTNIFDPVFGADSLTISFTIIDC